MLADRRHPLRFTLWTLLAIWVTATIAAGATYLISRSTESGERSYHGQDYTRSKCTRAPTGSALVDISGFHPLPAGEVALVTSAESLRKPVLIYVRQGYRRCLTEWTRDDS